MTSTPVSSILTINSGSSSIKFAVYEIEWPPFEVLVGEIEGIGAKESVVHYFNTRNGTPKIIKKNITDYKEAVNVIRDVIKDLGPIKAIGHRIVHGMKHTAPQKITNELIDEIKSLSLYDPEHVPGEVALIEILMKKYPDEIHVACFDTSFHTMMPEVAKWIPVPRRFKAQGVQRYGFHGLSYSYLLEELNRLAGSESANGRIIMAHLGNGASLAAVKNGKSIDTSMGFTPTGGLLMGTRTGDLDPGVAFYLLQAEKLNLQQFNHLINHESGLLGISGMSSDMRELLKDQANDSRAAEAIDVFNYQTKKWIGSFAAALGGVDTLIFSGGIGENASQIRASICSDLEFLGITLDESRNVKHEGIISSDSSRVCVRVIRTNEQLMIARLVYQFLKQ